MLAVLSPAKKLNFEPVELALGTTQPSLSKDIKALLRTTRTLRAQDLKRLMSLSPALAQLNYERFQQLNNSKAKPATKAAALAFAGDTYQGLQAWDFDDADLAFAQEHLRILSGLYGVLRPLDLIAPYRLEMGTRLKTERGDSLYQFWGDKLARELNKAALQKSHPAVVNLSSTEYFSAVQLSKLSVPVITCVFKEIRGGRATVVGFSAKRARGMMARYIVKERLADPEGMKAFSSARYKFDKKASSAGAWVFTRTSESGPKTTR